MFKHNTSFRRMAVVVVFKLYVTGDVGESKLLNVLYVSKF